MKNRLAQIRKKVGLSQSELSRRSKVTQQYISVLEADPERIPGVDIAAALATALGVHAEQVFPRIPRSASESRAEYFKRCYPELIKSLNEVDALRVSVALSCMDDSGFQTLCSWNKPLKWDQVLEFVFCFLKAIARRARLDELMKED